MNSFGRLFRVDIFGESHGECVGVLLDGVPPGLSTDVKDFKEDILRRSPGEKGTTARKETDIPQIKSGVFNGKTTGAPLLIVFENVDVDSKIYEDIKNTPRPGHADFTAFKKYKGFNDYRGGGHFSGRLTTGIVAGGVIAKKILKGVAIIAKVIEAGGSGDIERNVEGALKDKDSIGGMIECRVSGVEIGLGEPFFDSIESLFSHIIFSIPGIKGIEFGSGFSSAGIRGSEFNDVILDISGKTKTNHSGGISGGITNGNELYFRVAIRPTASIAKEQDTIDLKTSKKAKILVQGRHDACFALRVPVIIEAATAIVLADMMLINDIYKT